MSTFPRLPLPRFALDGTNRSALVVGRATQLGPVSTEDLERYVTVAEAQARETGLPLAVVCGAAVGVDDSYCGCAAGLVLATARQDERTEVDRSLLERTIDDVPATFWSALEAAGLSFPPLEDDDPEYPSIGIFVTPAGWSTASLFLGVRRSGEHGESEGDAELVVTSAAEDTAPPAVLSTDARQRILGCGEALVLEADYC